MTAHVAGRAQAGMLDFAYGAELHLFAQVHTSVLGHQFDWSGEVPLPTDYLVGHTTTFDPTLLPGAAVDHASGSDTTSPITLLSTDLIGDYIGIPGISGGLHLDAVGALTTSYRTTQVGLGDGGSPRSMARSASRRPRPGSARRSTRGRRLGRRHVPPRAHVQRRVQREDPRDHGHELHAVLADRAAAAGRRCGRARRRARAHRPAEGPAARRRARRLRDRRVAVRPRPRGTWRCACANRDLDHALVHALARSGTRRCRCSRSSRAG